MEGMEVDTPEAGDKETLKKKIAETIDYLITHDKK